MADASDRTFSYIKSRVELESLQEKGDTTNSEFSRRD